MGKMSTKRLIGYLAVLFVPFALAAKRDAALADVEDSNNGTEKSTTFTTTCAEPTTFKYGSETFSVSESTVLVITAREDGPTPLTPSGIPAVPSSTGAGPADNSSVADGAKSAAPTDKTNKPASPTGVKGNASENESDDADPADSGLNAHDNGLNAHETEKNAFGGVAPTPDGKPPGAQDASDKAPGEVSTSSKMPDGNITSGRFPSSKVRSSKTSTRRRKSSSSQMESLFSTIIRTPTTFIYDDKTITVTSVTTLVLPSAGADSTRGSKPFTNKTRPTGRNATGTSSVISGGETFGINTLAYGFVVAVAACCLL